MPFIDDLALELVSLAMLSGIVAYVTGLAYLEYRKDGPKNVENTLRLAVFPLGFLGAVITVLALWQEMTWPFPGGSSLYNIAFSDTYLVLGIIALAVALSLALRQRLQLVGFLALLGGIMAIYYGSVIYHYGYTQSPIATLGMYVAFGIAGILTYPATYAYDSMQAGKKPSMYFGVALILFWLFFIFAAVMAGIIGVPAVLQHLGSPP